MSTAQNMWHLLLFTSHKACCLGKGEMLCCLNINMWIVSCHLNVMMIFLCVWVLAQLFHLHYGCNQMFLSGSESYYYKELWVRLLYINEAVSTAALLNILAVTFSSGIFWRRMDSVTSGSKILFCLFLKHHISAPKFRVLQSRYLLISRKHNLFV